ncbi:unnamed protein product [Darwinula stevensoni]|uniref:Uncharacterized protein n=1 Tax=Darwinula stevensoni TaxID=69355 RepID=A0A7R9A8E1_9CRUS|nr:unnamed protein product [Darwinula stevensoni]CAG0896297.1 unnamed protein product [Darwinula stevensoni]
MKTYKYIFDFYICVASNVDHRLNPTQLFTRYKELLTHTGMILPANEKKLIRSKENAIFIFGGSGTGKTTILKERALELAKGGDVLVITLAGSLQAEEFRLHCKGRRNITVKKWISENLMELFGFLKLHGAGKDVLIDQVDITFRIGGSFAKKKPFKRWKNILCWKDHVKSLTFAFRTYDSSYTSEINVGIKMIPGVQVEILNDIRTKTRHLTEFILALESYSRRKFFCKEPNMKGIDFWYPEREFMPTFSSMHSCRAFHDRCWNKLTCEAVRSSHSISEHLRSVSINKQRPLYAVVDCLERRNRLGNALTTLNGINVIFINEDGESWGKMSNENPFSVIIVTADQTLGFHMENPVLILDFPDCKWTNFVRLVSSHHDNVFVFVERDQLQTGKYAQLTKMSVTETIADKIEADMREKMDMAQKMVEFDISHMDEKAWHRVNLPIRVQGKSLVPTKNPSRCTIIFGPPASGKSMMLLKCMKQLASHGQSQNRIILLHLGSILSHKAAEDYLRSHTGLFDIIRSDALCPKDVICHDRVMEIRRKHPNLKIHVHVDDYSIQAKETGEEIRMWTTALNDLRKDDNLIMTIAFKPHSRNGRSIDVEKLTSFFRSQPGVKVIRFPISKWVVPRCTSPEFLYHISSNEVNISSWLDVRCLHTISRPAAAAFGPKPKYIKYKCTGQHLNRSCMGQECCQRLLGVLVCFRSVMNENMDEDTVQVLLSDQALMKTLLKNTPAKARYQYLRFVHPKEFQGCTANVVFTVNVEDAWLMESVSRSMISLFVIDTLPSHQHIWDSMESEGFLEAQEVTSDDVAIDEDTLLRLDDEDKFLLVRPTHFFRVTNANRN